MTPCARRTTAAATAMDTAAAQISGLSHGGLEGREAGVSGDADRIEPVEGSTHELDVAAGPDQAEGQHEVVVSQICRRSGSQPGHRRRPSEGTAERKAE